MSNPVKNKYICWNFNMVPNNSIWTCCQNAYPGAAVSTCSLLQVRLKMLLLGLLMDY